MKLKQILMTAVLAIASMAAANASNTFNVGDVLFGITNTSTKAVTYNLDLGNISDLISLGAGSTKTWTLSSSDLNSSILGTTTAWNNNNKVYWGVAAETADMMWATSTSSSVQNPGTDTISGAQNALGNVIIAYQNGTATANQGASSNVTGAVSVNINGSTDWYSETANGANLGLETTVIRAESTTSSTSTLSLYSYDANAGTATKIGSFALTDDGTLTYTSLQAVPEPSTYAMLGIGGLAMIRVLRRRRTV